MPGVQNESSEIDEEILKLLAPSKKPSRPAWSEWQTASPERMEQLWAEEPRKLRDKTNGQSANRQSANRQSGNRQSGNRGGSSTVRNGSMDGSKNGSKHGSKNGRQYGSKK